MRIKERIRKLLVSTFIFLSIFNFIISSGGPISIVEATSGEESNPTSTDNLTNIEKTEAAAEELIGLRNNGVTGIMSWLLRVVVVGVASVFQIETFFVANSQGNDGSVDDVFITPLHIFFNKFTLTDINIFTTDGLDSDSFVYKMRVNASMWYLVFRSIALGLMLALLLYTGLRLMLANFAGEKAKYQQLLTNWVMGLMLAFFIHIIIVFVINVNSTLVSIIEKAANSANITDMVESIRNAAFSESYLLGLAATIVYVLMVIQTMIYLFIYIKRLLTVLFLVIISPVIAVTYSLDKSNGGTAKSLNGWFREFMYNVFIQPIHCIIYVVMVGVALDALSGAGEITELESLGPAIIAILSMLFIRKAEDLLREILGFNKSTTLTSSTSIVNSVTSTAIGAANVAATVATHGAVPLGVGGSKTPFGQNINNSNTTTNNTQNMFSNVANNVSNFFNRNGEENGLASNIGGLLGRGSNNSENGNGIGDSIFPGGTDSDGNDDSGNDRGLFDLNDDENDVNNSSENDTGNNSNESDVNGAPGGSGFGIPLNKENDEIGKDKIADAVKKVNKNNKNNNNNSNNNETNNNEINNNEINNNEEDSVDNKSENYNNTQNNSRFISGGIPGSELAELIKQVKILNGKLDELEEKKDKAQEKQDILDSIGSALPSEETETIRNNLEVILEDGNMDSAREYANSLGENTVEGRYANAYLDMKEVESAQQEYDSVSKTKEAILDEAKKKGIVDSSGVRRLSDGDYSVGNNENISEENTISNGGISLKNTSEEPTKGSELDKEKASTPVDTTVENIEVKEEIIENVDNEEEVELSEIRRTLDDVSGGNVQNILRDSAVKDETLKNYRLIEFLEGKAIVEAGLTDDSLTKFNVEVVAKVGKGSFSQSNFDEARRKVEQEGEKAMSSLSKYLQDPNLNTARELSPGGKQYAKLVAEAQQAGLVVTAARTMSNQSAQSNRVAETVIQQSGSTYSSDSRVNNVVGQINERKNSNNQNSNN